MEHSNKHINYICVSSDEQSNSTRYSSETDPLEGFGAEGALATKPRFYRMNSIVFAEPFKNYTNEEDPSKDQEDKDEITILDSVTIRKETGKKYKKYQFNNEDISSTKCPQLNCLRTFTTKKLLTAHIRRVHCADRNRYMCDQCGRGFPEPHILRRHADTHSEKTVECPVCNVKLRMRTSLSAHMRCHSNQRPHECLVCKKKFTRASSMATHVKFVHREGLLECDKCDKRFSSRKQWSLHRTSHRKKNPTPEDT